MATSEALIGETLAKMANPSFRASQVVKGLEKPFKSIESKLRVLQTWLRTAVAMTKSGSSASEAEKKAAETFVIYVLEFVRNVSDAIDVLFDRWENNVDVRSWEFGKKMEWMESQMPVLIHWATSSLGLPYYREAGEDSSAPPIDRESQPRLAIQDLQQQELWETALIRDRGFTTQEDEEERSGGPVVGLEEDIQIVVSRLVGGNATRGVLSIVGEEGIGKTTLANKVYSNSVIARHFPCRAWVALPREFETSSLMEEIGKQVGLGGFGNAEQERTLEELKERLHRFLRYKRHLIVFDDVRSPAAWNAIQELVPAETSNGSRILITTRNRDLIESGPNCHIHERWALSDEEGWELFNANLGYRVPLELEQLGREIVKKCLGLPPAISVVRDSLSKKSPTQELWSMVLNQISQDKVALYQTLNTTADALPPKLKQCLLYFGYFRQDYDIPARRLIVLWVAEGLFQQGIGDKEPPESVAHKLLMELIQQNMIQVAKWKLNGKVKTCRMNYLLREKWLSKPEEANFLQSSRVAHSSSGKILRLADHFDKDDNCFPHIHGRDPLKKSSLRLLYGDLCSFLSFDSREGPDPGEDVGNFLRRGIAKGCFKKLRVIDLEGVFQPKLPKSIGQLVELRYLGLRWTYLGMLPSSIGNLLNLQTLDLKNTKISSLPNSIWKMHQLRHLYLSESYRCRFVPPSNTNSLEDIQTLWGAFVDEESPVKDGLDRLVNLRKLGLVCRLTLPQQKELAGWITKLNHLESLSLKSIDEMVQPSNLYLEPLFNLNNLSSIYLFGRLENPIVVHEFPQSLTEITLSLSGLAEDPMPKLEKLPNLRILNLFSGSYTGQIMICSSGGFPLLRVLNLWKLEELEEWIVEEGALTILREVEMRSCNKLKMIPDGLKHLVHCCELKLTKMPHEFKSRITENEGQDWYKVAHIPSIITKD